MADHTMQERMDAAAEAKRAMLDKFKKKAADPLTEERRAEQIQRAQDRDAKRAAAEEKRKARIEAERKARVEEAQLRAMQAEEDAKRAAGEAEAKLLADKEASELLAFEQKARRDLRYATRKARRGKK